jgi:quercetin dioxygenase-like cupin family protein
MRHALSGQPVDVRPLGERLIETDSTALVTDDHLLVIRLVLMRGDGLPSHQVRGPVTMHCVEGRIEVVADEVASTMQAGDLVYLAGGSPRSLRALADSTLLVSLFRTAGHTEDGRHFAHDYLQLTTAPWPVLGDPVTP